MDPPTLFDAPDGGAGVAPPAARTPERRGTAPAVTRVADVGDRPADATLLAVDGDSLTHRAYHGYPPDRTAGPLHGFLALLAAVCDQAPVDGLVVGFDSPGDSERRRRYPGYKAQRDEKDPALRELLATLPERLRALGLQVVCPDGWEADDVVASAASTAEAGGWRCAVATSDRDAFCLVSERTTVLRLRGKGEIVPVTPRRLRADLRIDGRRYVEFAALRGDTSDNLPGVPGIGPARAAALLALYGSVEEAVADPIGCRSVLGPELGQALIDDLSSGDSRFRRNVDLMTPRRDLDIDLDAARLRSRPEDIADRLRDWGIAGLAGRLGAALSARPERVPLPEDPP